MTTFNYAITDPKEITITANSDVVLPLFAPNSSIELKAGDVLKITAKCSAECAYIDKLAATCDITLDQSFQTVTEDAPADAPTEDADPDAGSTDEGTEVI